MPQKLLRALSLFLVLSFFQSQTLYAFGSITLTTRNPTVLTTHSLPAPFHTSQPPNTNKTNIIGLSLSAMQGQQILNPGTTLEAAFNNIKPQLFSSLASWGIDKLSTEIGLPPLVGQTFGNAIFNTLNVAYQGGVDVGANIFRSVQEGFFQTAISYGLHFARDSISDPLLGSLASRALAGAIEGALFRQNIFQGLFDAAKQSVLDLFGANNQALLSNVTLFTTLVSEKGSLSAAFEAYATDIFDRATIESVIRSGGFTSALLSSKTGIQLPDGTLAKESTLSNGTSVIFDPSNNFLGLKRNNVLQLGKFGITNAGTFGLIDGKIYGTSSDGSPYEGFVKDGQAITLTINVQGNEIKIGGKDQTSIVYDQAGQILDGYVDWGRGAYNFIVNGGNWTDIFVTPALAADMTIVAPDGQIIQPTLPNFNPDTISRAKTRRAGGELQYLVRFMNQAQFTEVKLQNKIRPNLTGEIYTTDILLAKDAKKEYAAVSLQLGNDLTGGLIDPSRAAYFVVFDTKNLMPSPPPSNPVEKKYVGYEELLDNPGPYTGRNEIVFRGVDLWPNPFIDLKEKVDDELDRLIYTGETSLTGIISAYLAMLARGIDPTDEY